MHARTDKTRNGHVLLFTDGKTVSSRNWTSDANELRFLKLYNNLTCPVHTFGFGQYDKIDSNYLYSVTKNFDGMFGYIPDAVHLGTTFVNAIANIMTTCAHNLDLTLTFPNGTEIEDVIVGGLRHTQDQ